MEAVPLFAIICLLILALYILYPKSESTPDPVKECRFHRDMGCAHVDGPLCNMKTCQEMKEYREYLG